MADASVSVFISYSRTDSAFIDWLEPQLRAYGFDTWVDRQRLEGGTDWAQLIERQIRLRQVLVVALSPDAVESPWVNREITYAMTAGKYVIPVIARPVEIVPIRIILLHRIDLSSRSDSELHYLRETILKAPRETSRSPRAATPVGEPALESPRSRLDQFKNDARMAYYRQSWPDVMKKTGLVDARDAMTPDLWRMRFYAADALHDPQASEAIQKALQSDPDDAETLLLWGRVLAREGKDEDATNVFERASDVVALDDVNTRLDILGELCASLKRQSRWEDIMIQAREGQRVARDAQGIASDDSRWLRLVRDALDHLGRNTEALDIANALAARQDASGDDWLTLARLARTKELLVAAARALANAERLGIYTSDLEADSIATRNALVAQRKQEMAGENWQNALDLVAAEMLLSPDDWNLLLSRADLLRRLDRMAEAGEQAHSLIESSTWQSDPALALALARLCADLNLATEGWGALEHGGFVTSTGLRDPITADTLSVAKSLVVIPGASVQQRIIVARAFMSAGQSDEAKQLLTIEATSTQDRKLLEKTVAELFPSPPLIIERMERSSAYSRLEREGGTATALIFAPNTETYESLRNRMRSLAILERIPMYFKHATTTGILQVELHSHSGQHLLVVANITNSALESAEHMRGFFTSLWKARSDTRMGQFPLLILTEYDDIVRDLRKVERAHPREHSAIIHKLPAPGANRWADVRDALLYAMQNA